MNTVIVGTGPVSCADVVAVARGGAAVSLSAEAEAATDRFLAPEIEAAVAYVASGAAVRAAEAVTGPLE
jgi:histidine ammonia-lyase